MATRPLDMVVKFRTATDQFRTDEVVRELSAADAAFIKNEKAAGRWRTTLKKEGQRAEKDAKGTFGDAGKEAGDEFAQNLGESIGSGDISGLLSGTVGGLVGTFGKGGPIALAFGALAAVGVGAFQVIQQQAEKTAAAALTVLDDLNAGTEKQARLLNYLSTRFGDSVKGYERIARYSAVTSLSQSEIADLLLKGGPAARQTADELERQVKAIYDSGQTLGVNDGIVLDLVDDLRDQADAIDAGTRAYRIQGNAIGENLSAEQQRQAVVQGITADLIAQDGVIKGLSDKQQGRVNTENARYQARKAKIAADIAEAAKTEQKNDDTAAARRDRQEDERHRKVMENIAIEEAAKKAAEARVQTKRMADIATATSRLKAMWRLDGSPGVGERV